jgi:polar amino acid transport system ATP-binding protein
MSTDQPPAEPAVEIADLVKEFGSHRVLDGLDLTIPAGERLSIIGPSGSGKTTILRLLMGLEQPTAGSLTIDGTVVARPDGKSVDKKALRRARAEVGYVFQHFNLFPTMTIMDNVTLAMRRVNGASKREALARGEELLEQVGLLDKAHTYPARLSGGQQQRVAIARALALDPRIMLFDEVTSALDPELVGEVLKVILDLSQRTSMTMILVTHEMHFAERFSDRVIFIDGGRIVESGPPARIFHSPGEERTQRFLRAVIDPV